MATSVPVYDNRYKLVLDDEKDWDKWLSYIRKCVNDEEAWKLVDPDQSARPIRKRKPIFPPRPERNALGKYDASAMEEWRMEKAYFDQGLAEYADEHKALTKIHTIIMESVSARMIGQTAYTEIDAYNTLVALKRLLQPTDEDRSLQVERNYHRLATGPTNQNVEKWLEE